MAAPVSRRMYSSASFIIRLNTMRHIILDENIDITAMHNGTIILPNGSMKECRCICIQILRETSLPQGAHHS